MGNGDTCQAGTDMNLPKSRPVHRDTSYLFAENRI